MFPKPAALLAAAVAIAPVAVHAAPKPANMGDSVMTYDKAKDRYCMVAKQARTGSRLPDRRCLSAEQWKAEGLTVGRK